MHGYVYGLADPLYPHQIRYVGITKQTLSRRLDGHLRSAGDHPPVRRWIRDLREEGRRPLILELEELDEDEVALRTAERKWIVRLWSPLLLNRTSGGNGRTGRRSPETIARMRAAQLGHHVSKEARLKIGRAGLGRVPWNKGRLFTPEIRAKMSAAASNRSPEVRERMSLAKKGRPITRVCCTRCRREVSLNNFSRHSCIPTNTEGV